MRDFSLRDTRSSKLWAKSANPLLTLGTGLTLLSKTWSGKTRALAAVGDHAARVLNLQSGGFRWV